MKQRFLYYTAALCATLSAAFVLSGCRENAIIKSSLTPAVDNIHTFGIGPDFNNGTDTFISLLTKTVFEDSLITSTRQNGFPIFHALGWVTDPFAGNTAGSIYMQVAPTAAKFTIPSTVVVDDLVLVLPYGGFTWGDTTTVSSRTVKVYAIDQSFSKDTTYYSSSRLNTKSTLIGTATIKTGPKFSGGVQDSVSVLGVNKVPHLRITLSQSFKDEFRNLLTSDSTIPSFLAAFPGLYIVPDSAGAGVAMPYFRLNGSGALYGSAAVVAYAHTSGKSDTLVYNFPYDETAMAHFNRITRNYSGTPSAILQDTNSAHDLLMMQNGPGTVIDIRLPNIKDIPKNVIINKAELVFTKANDPTGTDNKFFGPARLYPQGINSSGGHYTIADRYPVTDASLDFIDGTPRSAVKGGTTVTEYRVNIPRELQKAIVQGSDVLHLRIGGTANFPAAYRLIVGGRAILNPLYRPSINIIYSKQ